jgi:hypothetical protein
MSKIICNSLTNCAGGEYCKKCSHGRRRGSGLDDHGKVWRWEHNPWFGPLFLGTRGEPLKRQPITPSHRAWQPYLRWIKRQKRGE